MIEPILVLSREETNRFVYLCDLLFNFLLQHSFRSSFYVLSTGLMSRLATLLKAKDKHLRHGKYSFSIVLRHKFSCRAHPAAFRIFRLLLKQNNPNTHKQMLKLDILHPILELTLQESRRDNLLSCSCQEFFENMRRVGIRFPLVTDCVIGLIELMVSVFVAFSHLFLFSSNRTI